jgi:hypothetical protein
MTARRRSPSINSQRKGKAGELEYSGVLRAAGFLSARRGCQFKGGPDSPDIDCVELPHVHFEVKRTEKGNPYNWLDQATADKGVGQVPVVAHRRNGRDWIAILHMDDFLELLRTVAEIAAAAERAPRS